MWSIKVSAVSGSFHICPFPTISGVTPLSIVTLFKCTFPEKSTSPSFVQLTAPLANFPLPSLFRRVFPPAILTLPLFKSPVKVPSAPSRCFTFRLSTSIRSASIFLASKSCVPSSGYSWMDFQEVVSGFWATSSNGCISLFPATGFIHMNTKPLSLSRKYSPFLYLNGSGFQSPSTGKGDGFCRTMLALF